MVNDFQSARIDELLREQFPFVTGSAWLADGQPVEPAWQVFTCPLGRVRIDTAAPLTANQRSSIQTWLNARPTAPSKRQQVAIFNELMGLTNADFKKATAITMAMLAADEIRFLRAWKAAGIPINDTE